MRTEIVQATASVIICKYLPEIRVGHWSTGSYALHTATGAMYDFLTTWTDSFIEVAVSKSGRFNSIKSGGEELVWDPKAWISSLRNLCATLKKETTREDDSDLSNLVDELLAQVNKLAYLLTLK